MASILVTGATGTVGRHVALGLADRFSEGLGRDIRYANPSILDFVRHMRGQDHPWPFVLVMTGIYLTARFGLAATVTDGLERVLGRPPTSMRAFIRDYRSCWVPDSER
jgi:nucleoside-diphosphate-sugar epimerase